MDLINRVARKLFGREENVFLGLWFILFLRRYNAAYGTFELPLRLSKCHLYARFLNGTYEVEERGLITRYLKDGDHVLELGGCVGVVSCLTSKIIGEGGRHCVVEANPYLIPYLYRNKHRNNANFLIIGTAVSEKKTLPFFIHKNMLGSSVIRETKERHHITCQPLSRITETHGPFNVLIMDIEGGEEDLISENKEQLEKFEKLIIEFHPSIIGSTRVKDIYRALEQSGFHCADTEGTVSYFQKERAQAAR